MQGFFVKKGWRRRRSSRRREDSGLIERSETIETADGGMEAFVARPAGRGPFTPVILFQHIGGLSETMRIVARRIAQGGFYCVVPALYHRLGRIVIDPVDPSEPTAAIRAIAVGSLRPPQVMGDVADTLAFLRGDPAAKPGRRGVVGFGGGAAYGFLAAATFPAEIGAMASILGVGFIKDAPDSAHLMIDRIRGELYFAFAERDHIISASSVEAVRGWLAKSNAAAQVVVHPGVEHGYVFSDRGVYDATAAEQDWAAFFAMLQRMSEGPDVARAV